MADVRDARIKQIEAELGRAHERERQLGEIIAQQQTLIASQQQLIADLQRRLAEQDAEHAARAAHLEVWALTKKRTNLDEPPSEAAVARIG